MLIQETATLAPAPAVDRVRQHFDRNTHLYVKKVLPCYEEASLSRLRQLEAAVPSIDSTQCRLLDIGCGGGLFLDLFLDRFSQATAVGIDLSKEMLKHNTLSGRKTLRQADALSLPADIGNFHVINVDTVMHHLVCQDSYDKTLRQIKRFLISMHRLLMPGGVIMVREIFHEYRGVKNFGTRAIFELSTLRVPGPVEFAIKKAGIHTANAGVCFLSRDQWAATFTQAGFSVLSEEENPWTTQPYRRFGFAASGDIHYVLGRTRPRIF